MNHMAHFDIAIIGGGLAGLSLALALAQQTSLTIAIIETQHLENITQRANAGRSLALSYGSARIYQALGIWDVLQQMVYPILHIHVSERGGFGMTRFSATKHNVPALGYVIRLERLQTILYQRLKACANVTWFNPDAVINLKQTIQHSEIHLQQAGIIYCQLLVGADGTHSTVRSLLNIATQSWEYTQQALVTTIELAQPLQQTAYERFSRDGPIALLPISRQQASLIWTGTKQQVTLWRNLGETDFIRILQRSFGYRAGRITHTKKRIVFPLQFMRAKEYIRQGVVLIGHAAHTIHPIAAQGFNLSLRDVATLAEILNDGLHNGIKLSDITLLKHYQQWRKADYYKMLGFTDALIRLFSNDLMPLRIGRNVGLIACDLLPGAKHTLARHTLGIAGKLPRLACGVQQ